MNRGIDHLVLCVHDLDADRRFYERLGFTTTPRADHPFGTDNSLVQFQGNFIELLAVVEPDNIRPADPGHFAWAPQPDVPRGGRGHGDAHLRER